MRTRVFAVAVAGILLACVPGRAGSADGGKSAAAPVEGGSGDVGKAAPAPAPMDGGGSIHLNWMLMTSHLLGSNNNGFSITCEKAGVQALTLTVKGTSGAASVLQIACPKEATRGELDVKLPSGKGPYTLKAAVPGKPKLKSENIEKVGNGEFATLRIYVNGCDEVCD